jgi:hypothetical protein
VVLVAAEDHPSLLVAQEAQAVVLVYLDGDQMELEVLLVTPDIVAPEDQTAKVVVIVERLMELHFMDLVVVEMIREPPHTMALKALCD